MGLFKRAVSFKGGTAKRKGLLQKSRELIASGQKTEPPETAVEPAAAQVEAGPSLQEQKNRILQALEGLQDGIEAPGELFCLLVKELKLAQAALLLYDPLRMVFAPWASVGYDTTTLRRVRIPLGYNQSFNRVANGDVLTLKEKAALEEFKPFFSSREFSLLSELIFVPFISAGKLAAVLLITRAGAPPNGESEELYRALAAASAPLINRAREEKLTRLKREPLEASEPLEDRVQALAQKAQKDGRPLVLIKMALDKIVESIRVKNPYMDQFRLKEDICVILSSHLIDIGVLVSLDQKHVLLLIQGMEEADPGLLVHHLGLTLTRYFRELTPEHKSEFSEETRVYPCDGADALKLLAELA